MGEGVIEAAPLAPHHPVWFAGTGSGALDQALACANEAEASVARRYLADALPGMPITAEQRERNEAVVQAQATGTLLDEITPALICDAMETYIADPDRVHVVRREPCGPRAQDLGDPSQLGVEDLHSQMDTGGTVQLTHLDEVLAPCARLATAVERSTGGRVNVNAVVSGPNCDGLGRHVDDAEVWAIQLLGDKQWTFWSPSMQWYDHRRPAPGLVPLEDVLATMHMVVGKALAMQRGTFHQVLPTGRSAVGLNVLIDIPSPATLTESFLAGRGAVPTWQEPLHSIASLKSAADALGWPTSAQLSAELARFRAATPPRPSIADIEPGSGESCAYRSAISGGVHPVEDVPFFDTIVVACGNQVLRLKRSTLDFLPMIFGGQPFSEGTLASCSEASQLVADLLELGVIVPVAPDPNRDR